MVREYSVIHKLPFKQTRPVDGNVICRDGGSRTVSSCRRAGQDRKGLAGRQDAAVLVSGIPRGSCPACSFDSHTAHIGQPSPPTRMRLVVQRLGKPTGPVQVKLNCRLILSHQLRMQPTFVSASDCVCVGMYNCTCISQQNFSLALRQKVQLLKKNRPTSNIVAHECDRQTDRQKPIWQQRV